MIKKLVIIISISITCNTTVQAQTKAQSKIDSIKLKTSVNEQSEKFRKNDSAYKALEIKKTTELKYDSADLKLTTCDFEKSANAMVLDDKAIMVFGGAQIAMERYKRIKIFNDKGKQEANVRLEYSNRFGAEHILAIVAETINFNNGKIEHTKLDSTLIYNVHTDKEKDAIVFTMPNVKAGSIIEYAYVWQRSSSRNFPDWDFQCDLPTRYSEVNILLNPQLVFTQLTSINQPFTKDTSSFNGYGHTWAMEDIPSSKNEPYMRSAADGLQRVSIIIKGVKGYFGTQQIADSWWTLGVQIANDKLFYKPYDEGIGDDNGLVKSAKALKGDDEKVEFLFNQVKTQMKWNEEKNWISKDGIKAAWKKKSGNWGEINMVLCHLLNKAGVKAYPLLVSTRDNGLMYSTFPNFFQVNKLVAYVPIDSTQYYVLDASDKYNLYNEIPYELLNSVGLCLDKEKQTYNIVTLKKDFPVKQTIFINAEIKPDGTMTGNAEISDFSYNKSSNMELYKTFDEKEYKEYLTGNDNNLKITSLKLYNSDIDSLPLIQNIDFKLDLSGTDEKYIYFNPNLFTSLRNNPFVSQERASDIDFGYKNVLIIAGRYKLPAGYTVDFLPKNANIVTPEKSITFKRLLSNDDGIITISYVIKYNYAVYSKADYNNLYAYFKKMYKMLNEQIVLKKS